MNISFATKDERTAFKFLKTEDCYSKKEMSPKTLPKLCDALRRDIVRITDPDFHSLSIIGGDNYADKDKPLLDEILIELHNAPEEK